MPTSATTRTTGISIQRFKLASDCLVVARAEGFPPVALHRRARGFRAGHLVDAVRLGHVIEPVATSRGASDHRTRRVGSDGPGWPSREPMRSRPLSPAAIAASNARTARSFFGIENLSFRRKSSSNAASRGENLELLDIRHRTARAFGNHGRQNPRSREPQTRRRPNSPSADV